MVRGLRRTKYCCNPKSSQLVVCSGIFPSNSLSFGRFHCRFSIFFFSSRRRHTRCSRDWSSDVCSSDLVERSGTSTGKMLALHPEESRPVRAKQPLVPGADEKIGAQLPHVHGHCPATLAHIEKQESALLVARPSDARRIQQRAVVVAHQAHGNDARSWRHRPNQIVDRNRSEEHTSE